MFLEDLSLARGLCPQIQRTSPRVCLCGFGGERRNPSQPGSPATCLCRWGGIEALSGFAQEQRCKATTNFAQSDPSFGVFRAFFGINLCMHGVARILAGQSHFEAKITTQFAHTFLPHGFLVAFALALSWVEAIFGFLILLGLWTRAVLAARFLLMLMLTFGVCLVQDWPTAGLQLSYRISLAVLLFLLPYNRCSVDSLLHANRVVE